VSLSLSGSLSSLKASLTDPSLLRPDTPLPDRNDFRNITGKVEVIMFDFDGTLTATPGDRQVRIRKRAEICERASLLQARLQALREAGCLLGIISKSTEATIRDALSASGLSACFDAPILGKAVGFEGKVGFIQDLARRGSLRRPGDRRPGPAPHRILLVDDDVLELERANAGGLQTYAAPSEGGLQEQDFEAIQGSLRLPPGRPHPRPSLGKCSTGTPPIAFSSALFPSAEHSLPLAASTGNGKWRNLILFSGECFEG
jgi:FMN phosphatase YigB (HAD superfamily)